MEHMINFIMSTIGTMCVGILTNYIYDKLKSHSVQMNCNQYFGQFIKPLRC